MRVSLPRLLLLFGCLTLGGCCLSPAGEGVDAGTLLDDSLVDGGAVDGGDVITIKCTNMLECGCTCTCPSGASGVTYASCIFGFCEDCVPYCYDFCL